MKFKVDAKAIAVKSIATGLVLGLLSTLAQALLVMIGNIGLAFMEDVVLILSAVLLLWALWFRQGKENLLEAFISMAFVFGIWGIIGYFIGFNPVGKLAGSGSMSDFLLFLMLFFTSEALGQRLLKQIKWL